MATYADFTYYSSTYLGTAIASGDWARLGLRASAWIDRLTFQRTAAIVTAGTDTATIALIKNATCAVAEDIQRTEANGGTDAIQSESIGQNSVTYAAGSSKMNTTGETYMQTASLYLGSTGLMFPGFEAGEYSGEIDED
jgi:hypothetical protein